MVSSGSRWLSESHTNSQENNIVEVKVLFQCMEVKAKPIKHDTRHLAAVTCLVNGHGPVMNIIKIT